MAPLIPLVVLLVRVLASVGSTSGQQGGPPKFTRAGRSLLWATLVCAWIVLVLVWLVGALSLIAVGHVFTRSDLIVIPESLGVGFGACFLFRAWPILRWLARRGRPKLVYYLAHFALIFPGTGETYAGASLLAGLALAHRGSVKKSEREWMRARLAKETHHLGTYATACALHQMLKARSARDKGRVEKAASLAQRARTILGTVTYLSPQGIPHGVLKVAYELLALDDARRGNWGSLEIVEERDLTPLARVLRGWPHARDSDDNLDPKMKKERSLLRKKMRKERKKVDRLRRGLQSKVLDDLFARSSDSDPKDASEAWERTRRAFIALLRREVVGPRALMNMLVGFDILLHPECPDTVIPESVRTNEALVAELHEEIAQPIAEALLQVDGPPIHAMRVYGPISARVYQRVEAALFQEMERAFDVLEERLRIGDRLDPFSEWCQVSYLRSIYRRIGIKLGEGALAQLWPRFVYRYCKLGVDLSEMYPRMRPLAHAVFRCLSGEARRFNDLENMRQQTHNMSVTAGVE